MTYCVGLYLKDALVMLSDTRTNAGVDNISIFSKTHIYEITGERFIAVMTSGNLATSQAVVNMLHEGIDTGERVETLYTVPTMFRAAQLIGIAVRRVFAVDGPTLEAQGVKFEVSLILGGQIRGQGMRLFHVYSAGNFIEATPDTPFLQIGETKYGKPILDRALQFDTDPRDGVKLVLVSMDSTLRSNLTVGLPIDLLVYRRDQLTAEVKRRITEEDPYFKMIRDGWSKALRDAYRAFPRPDWFA
ncbi:MAG TPA: proteasome-type protease, partial [Stellaceae bacterium]|jgi:putative proteasome-type protease|nr:proteasome-type protease [Stellaceae bacterium]